MAKTREMTNEPNAALNVGIFNPIRATVNQMIGNKAKISIGSVVTKPVMENERVTGNFAIEHSKFLENIKKSLQ